MFNRRKRTVEYIVEDGYWEGFFACLCNGSPTAMLEYQSDSGWYQYNDCRRIAYKAGYEFCEQVLKERAERLADNRLNWFTIDRKIPGRVMAEAYGAARLT